MKFRRGQIVIYKGGRVSSMATELIQGMPYKVKWSTPQGVIELEGVKGGYPYNLFDLVGSWSFDPGQKVIFRGVPKIGGFLVPGQSYHISWSHKGEVRLQEGNGEVYDSDDFVAHPEAEGVTRSITLPHASIDSPRPYEIENTGQGMVSIDGFMLPAGWKAVISPISKPPRAKGFYWVCTRTAQAMVWIVGEWHGSEWTLEGLIGTFKDDYMTRIDEKMIRLKEPKEHRKAGHYMVTLKRCTRPEAACWNGTNWITIGSCARYSDGDIATVHHKICM